MSQSPFSTHSFYCQGNTYRLGVYSSTKYLSARIQYGFIATHLQNQRAAMAQSAPPLTLFKSPHRQKSLLKQEKKEHILLVSVFLSCLQVKIFIHGYARNKSPSKPIQVNVKNALALLAGMWVKHLAYFSMCSHLPTLQCSAATTHNCELIWILSECHPGISVNCIVLPATFQFLSKLWKILASASTHTHTCTHTCTHITHI